MTREESIKEIVKFVEQFPDGIELYGVADKFRHLTDRQYSEHLNRAIRRRQISLIGFYVYPGHMSGGIE